MNNFIPFHRPMLLQPEEQNKIVDQMGKTMSSGILTNNNQVRLLEERIKDIHKVDYAIATSSCSQGLVITLQALNQTEHNVPYYCSTQAFTWYSTHYAIRTAGKFPVMCDINTDTWNIEEESDYLNFAVPVHTFGNVSRIASKFKVYDGAHCLGAKTDDIGNATVISLAPTKLITSIEGGIILTNDKKLAKHAEDIRDKVSRMSEINAIFGNTYLDHLYEVLKWKREVYLYYKKHLDGIFQKTDQSSNHNTIGMLTGLKIPEHIETRKYYKPIDHSDSLPNTEAIYESIVCLPSWYECPYKQIVKDICEFNNTTVLLD